MADTWQEELKELQATDQWKVFTDQAGPMANLSPDSPEAYAELKSQFESFQAQSQQPEEPAQTSEGAVEPQQDKELTPEQQNVLDTVERYTGADHVSEVLLEEAKEKIQAEMADNMDASRAAFAELDGLTREEAIAEGKEDSLAILDKYYEKVNQLADIEKALEELKAEKENQAQTPQGELIIESIPLDETNENTEEKQEPKIEEPEIAPTSSEDELLIERAEEEPTPAPQPENTDEYDWRKVRAETLLNEAKEAFPSDEDKNFNFKDEPHRAAEGGQHISIGATRWISPSENVLQVGYQDGDNSFNVFKAAVSVAKKENKVVTFNTASGNDFNVQLMIECINRDVDMNPDTMPKMNDMPEDIKAKYGNLYEKAVKAQLERKTTAQANQELNRAEDNDGNNSYTAKIQELRRKGLLKTEEAQQIWEKAREEHMTPERKALRELRGLAKSGDIEAKKELMERRESTMTEEYKYKIKKGVDEQGKEFYLKDEKGEYVYDLDKDGNKQENDGYKAYKANLANLTNERS